MDEWEAVDSLLEENKISAQLMNYLFVRKHHGLVVSAKELSSPWIGPI